MTSFGVALVSTLSAHLQFDEEANETIRIPDAARRYHKQKMVTKTVGFRHVRNYKRTRHGLPNEQFDVFLSHDSVAGRGSVRAQASAMPGLIRGFDEERLL